MNPYPLPYIPIGNNYNIICELNELKERVQLLEEKINTINEKDKDNNYLKKDDNYYMI